MALKIVDSDDDDFLNIMEKSKRSSYKLDTSEISDIVIQEGSHLIIKGQTTTGKSRIAKLIIRDLIMVKKEYKSVILFGNLAKEKQYDYIHPSCRHDIYPPEVIQQCWDVQKKNFDETGEKCIFFMDDIVGGSRGYHEDKFFDKLVSTCRHHGILLILSVQYLKYLSPATISNTKQFIITTMSPKDIEVMHESGSVDDKSILLWAKTKLCLGNSLYINNQPFVGDDDKLSFLHCGDDKHFYLYNRKKFLSTLPTGDGHSQSSIVGVW